MRSRQSHQYSWRLTEQFRHTPPPLYLPRMSIESFISATSSSYRQAVACPLQLHFSQWKPLPEVPGFHGTWLYIGQHFSHISPHVCRSHSHSWRCEWRRNFNLKPLYCHWENTSNSSIAFAVYNKLFFCRAFFSSLMKTVTLIAMYIFIH